MNLLLLTAFGLLAALILVIRGLGSTWLRAQFAGTPVSFAHLFAMRYLRKSPVDTIVNARIMVAKAGCEVPLAQLEAHSLAGGDLIATVQAYIQARSRGDAISWKEVCAIDLARPAEIPRN